MNTYVAMLRGINVSGQKIIKMDRLKSIFESMQLQEVSTYIQSGNVIFQTTETDKIVLRGRIESTLKESLGYDIPVVIRSNDELDEVVRRNPFAVTELLEDEKVYVTFLASQPTAEAVEHFESYNNDVDDFRVLNREVYILSRKGYGKSLFSNNFVEKKLKVAATTRNWETVNKLADLSRR
ncbi:hypothetical protein QJ48_31120 [Paenibacillus sp. A3]|uniref:DUF1697 domain-containing protein n=1 Tax=Paenibacillus sp. A3 TaxID=1337054 RepID=UPI0006D58750|nr:DUF1697 domain-containing protein [Paenibacillus sp. A3]KPV55837.1 hypothetical protein QJ48_31120 [Paenibacillus sp. A3]